MWILLTFPFLCAKCQLTKNDDVPFSLRTGYRNYDSGKNKKSKEVETFIAVKKSFWACICVIDRNKVEVKNKKCEVGSSL